MIQGTADADGTGTLSRQDVHKTLEYFFNALMHISPNTVLIEKLKRVHGAGMDGLVKVKAIKEFEKNLTEDESREIKYILGFVEEMVNIDNFAVNSVDGLVPNLERRHLGLEAEKVKCVRL